MTPTGAGTTPGTRGCLGRRAATGDTDEILFPSVTSPASLAG